MHVRFLSLSVFAIAVVAFICVAGNNLLLIASGVLTSMVLNWVITSWVFNPLEMGVNQIIFGYALAVVMVCIPVYSMIRNNIKSSLKKKRDTQCKRDAASKYRNMMKQANEMKYENNILKKEIENIKDQLLNL
jgi:S-adenosylmethionine synthetase